MWCGGSIHAMHYDVHDCYWCAIAGNRRWTANPEKHETLTTVDGMTANTHEDDHDVFMYDLQWPDGAYERQ
ncbi:MAG: hypothetical protein WC732_08805 [Candidatus Omnitrophota bacterium]